MLIASDDSQKWSRQLYRKHLARQVTSREGRRCGGKERELAEFKE